MKDNIKENVKVRRLKASHRAIYTDIEIDADVEKVWAVLTDTSSYKDWAAFMVDIQGEIRHGQKIKVVFRINPKKDKTTSIEHAISVKEGNEFYWSEKGPGGIQDNHHFIVEPMENGKTRFIQSDEIMKGITWLMGGKLSKMYSEGYSAFNRNLKIEVERRTQIEKDGL